MKFPDLLTLVLLVGGLIWIAFTVHVVRRGRAQAQTKSPVPPVPVKPAEVILEEPPSAVEDQFDQTMREYGEAMRQSSAGLDRVMESLTRTIVNSRQQRGQRTATESRRLPSGGWEVRVTTTTSGTPPPEAQVKPETPPPEPVKEPEKKPLTVYERLLDRDTIE